MNNTTITFLTIFDQIKIRAGASAVSLNHDEISVFSRLAEAQSKGLKCAYIDCSYDLDPRVLVENKIDPDLILICQPDNDDQGIEVLEMLSSSEKVDLAVFKPEKCNSIILKMKKEPNLRLV